MKNKNEELSQRIKALSEDAQKRKQRIEKEVTELEKVCYEIIDLQKRLVSNEQDNGG